MGKIKAPNPTFDAAATHEGRLNMDLQSALIGMHSRLMVLERATGIGALDPDKQAKTSATPPRADVTLKSDGVGSGRFTLQLRNPEFIRGRGNSLRTPIYHRVAISNDPTFRTGVSTLDPSTQTHWSIPTLANARMHVQVQQSYDGENWNSPIVKGPVLV